MTLLTGALRLPLLKSVYRIFGLGLVIFFFADLWFALEHIDLMADSEAPTEYANSFALCFGALLSSLIAQQYRLRSVQRVFWWLVGIVLVILAANELFDLPQRMDRAWSGDGYSDLIILFMTPIGLYVACTMETAPRLFINSMKIGFVFQCISDIIDLGDGDFYTLHLFNRNLMEMLTDLSQLIFVETYLFGLVCLLLSLLARRFDSTQWEKTGI